MVETLPKEICGYGNPKPVQEVKDIDKMTDFYKKILGMKVRKQEKELTELGTDRDTLLILKTNKEINYRKPETANLYHIAYLLPERTDLAVFLKHITDMGIRGAGAADHLVSEAIYLNDPENNGIENDILKVEISQKFEKQIS